VAPDVGVLGEGYKVVRGHGLGRDREFPARHSANSAARSPFPGGWGAGYEDTCATREVACDSQTPHRAPVAHPMFVLRSAGWRALPDQGWPGNSISRGDARCPHNTDTGTPFRLLFEVICPALHHDEGWAIDRPRRREAAKFSGLVFDARDNSRTKE